MSSLVEELMQTVLAASPDRKEAALRVLRGQAHAVEPGAQAPVYEPLLTQRETARRLGVSVSTLWRWHPPSHNLGGRRRYYLSEVLEYLQSEAFKRRQAALRVGRRADAGTRSHHSIRTVAGAATPARPATLEKPTP